MTLFVQTVINGMTAGSVYGWLAVGLSMVFLSSSILNFAGAACLVCSGYIYFWLAPSVGEWGAAFVAVFLGTLLGGATRLVARGEPWRGTLNSVGLFLLLVGFIPAAFGSNAVSPPGLLGNGQLRIFGAVLTYDELLVLTLFVVSGMSLGLVLSRSVIGWTLRAVAESRVDAQRMGVNAVKLVVGSFLLAGLLWSVGGVLIIPVTGFDPTTSGTYLGYGLTAMVLGGAGNPFAALIGGLLLGIVSAASDTYISPLLGPTAAFVILVLALVVKPNIARRLSKGAHLATQDAIRI